MNKKQLLLLFSFLLVMNSFAQVPGYMGKRVTIGYSASLCPNLLNISSGSHTPVLSHSFNINYIFTKQREICFSLKYCNREIINRDYIYHAYLISDEYEKLSSLEYALGFKRFNRSKFAPIGAYSKWEGLYVAGWMNYAAYGSTQLNYAGVSTNISNNGGTIQINSFGGAYTRGRQRIFKDKLVVDFGVRIAVIHVIQDVYPNNYESNRAQDVWTTLNFNPILNGFIGIGFLAF